MITVLADLPDATHAALAQACAVLARSKTRLAAANLFADQAERHLNEAGVRADLLQSKMADVKYARRAT